MQKKTDHRAPTALVFGASGQIGTALLTRLTGMGWEVAAVSRQEQAAIPGVQWIIGDFHACWEGPRRFDAVFSCGPLNHFVSWFIQGPLHVSRVVAFSSTSAQVKQDSDEQSERQLAEKLSESEQLLFAYCQQRSIGVTVLRPTLVWGSGRDLSVSRIARLGARRHFFVVPSSATGLRQPVHVDDLAHAASSVASNPACVGKAYDLPGGESLPYLEMVRRIQRAVPGCSPLLSVPRRMFSAVVWAAQRCGKLPGVTAATLQRMSQDLVFDIAPAQRDFGYAPRGFQPQPGELGLDQ